MPPAAAAPANEYTVADNEELRAAVADIKRKRDDEGLSAATIVFTKDIEFDYDKHPGSGFESGSSFDSRYVGKNYFSGIDGVTLTLKSPEGADPVTLTQLGATWGSTRTANAGFEPPRGGSARCFTGPLVLDNVVLDPVRDDVYYFAQGNALETTERFAMTRKAHVYGGTMGMRVRQDGMGFGDTDGIGNDGSVLGWREPSGGVDSTKLVLRGGQFNSVVGGGYNGRVENGTSVLVELPDDVPWTSNKANCSYIYGGGTGTDNRSINASEGYKDATVASDVDVQALSGVFGEVFGGSYKGTIRGDVSVTVGKRTDDPAAPRAVYTDVYGGSYMGEIGQRYGWEWIGGDVVVTMKDTARGSDYIDYTGNVDGTLATVHGAGQLDEVNGTTRVVLDGGGNNYHVFAAGSNSDQYSDNSNIKNVRDEKIAASITINGGEWGGVYSCVNTHVSSTAEQLVDGDVVVTMNGGYAKHFNLSAYMTHVTGDSLLAINGGEIGNIAPAICGYQYVDHSGNTLNRGQVDGKRRVELKNANAMHCWGVYAVDEIVVENTAPFFIEPAYDQNALESCGNLDIRGGAIVLRGSSQLVDTASINGTMPGGASKGAGDLNIAPGAVLALNAASESDPNGCIEAQGNATGAGGLLVVDPSGSWRKSRVAKPKMPVEGEVYIRSDSADETAAPGGRAKLATLANSPTDLYVQYTTDAAATTAGYSHAWRIARDPDARRVTVSYDVNGGDPATKPADQVVVIGGGQASGHIDGLPAAPSRDGYEFCGWNTEGDGSGIVFDETYDVSADMTVYAQWRRVAPRFTVTYTDGVDGEEVFADKVFADIEEGAETPLFGVDPQRAGYAFGGWEPTVSPTVTQTVVYKAKWVKDAPPQETYTVTYTDGVDGEEVFADKVFDGLHAGDKTPSFGSDPVRAGYTFAGWSPELAEVVTGDAVYRATWRRNWTPPIATYTVTYTDGVEDDEVFADKVFDGFKYGDKTPAFGEDPVREGYEFAGWSPEVADTVTGDAVYTATWRKAEVPPVDPEPEPEPEPGDPEKPSDPDSGDESGGTDKPADKPGEGERPQGGLPATGDAAIATAAAALLCGAAVIAAGVCEKRRRAQR